MVITVDDVTPDTDDDVADEGAEDVTDDLALDTDDDVADEGAEDVTDDGTPDTDDDVADEGAEDVTDDVTPGTDDDVILLAGVVICPRVISSRPLVQNFCAIDPSEPTNMRLSLAFEKIQAGPHNECLNDFA